MDYMPSLLSMKYGLGVFLWALIGSSWVCADSFELGLGLGHYKYTEPGLMHLKDWQGEVFGIAKIDLESGVDAVRVDLSFSYASLDYWSNGTGTSSGHINYTGDFRVMWDRKWEALSDASSFYFGVGYRYLFNDLRGTTSTGHKGYKRISQYVYIPTGIDYWLLTSSQWAFLFNVELGLLLFGQQSSDLRSVDEDLGVLKHNQSSGYNFRLKTLAYIQGFRVGPYLEYWWVDDSEIVSNTLEPENNTLEWGVLTSYAF